MNVRPPRITSIAIAKVRNGVSSPSGIHSAYFAEPTSAAARPPNAWDSAVRCGTAVRGTFDSGTPIAVPITIATTIQRYPTISGSSSVPMMARAMPATPAATPRRAVEG